jgi:hypothetical protein
MVLIIVVGQVEMGKYTTIEQIVKFEYMLVEIELLSQVVLEQVLQITQKYEGQ